ncbi:hypothetical protein CONPUDRAFT_45042 [Coniophora puteana RWD-64-598 SS2]|uniref:ATP-dependent DNA helicase n=1 Tax=Coniophora puteana (strain RWD-64-598) TaxID=741705 RepID=A0A5M3N5Z0_CONPW|nr:uncharacterized protein CONPUDRAFT_45042 [Coniophora puteana RWD-64-598 SS2]EIW86687.1 hypothetical protein CONPUDRAFT_45042 [Coniophora puteana RWD-64-598 SS2]
MRAQRKRRRPEHEPSNIDDRNVRQRVDEILPQISANRMADGCDSTNIPFDPVMLDESTKAQIMDNIIDAFQLRSNKEQMQAFLMIAEHFLLGKTEQLLMFLSGIGGSGKSHVIRAVVELFRRCGCSERLMLAAPTGAAAVLINGYTIHSLTFLPSGKFRVNHTELEGTWKLTLYLILDEVSMIGAQFLAEISQRMSAAKSWQEGANSLPFGGMNVIFSGDMGQLPQPRALSLYSHKLVSKLRPNLTHANVGQLAMQGICLWRQVHTVVELKQNIRAKKDPDFIALLNRIRVGSPRKFANQEGLPPDHVVLCSRILSTLKATDLLSAHRFRDVPIIVGRKTLRDAINMQKCRALADSLGVPFNWYYSKDRRGRKPLSSDIQKMVWQLDSSSTDDALSKLPLVPNMPVMITENISIGDGIVNGTEGTLVSVKFSTDARGRRFAECVYVKIIGTDIRFHDLDAGIVPVFATSSSFTYQPPHGEKYSVSRTQLPILPAWCMIDYKAQGRTMSCVVVDLTTATSLQNVYVMLSRATSLDNLAILRTFSASKIQQHAAHDLRNELHRIDIAADKSSTDFARTHMTESGLENVCA